MRKLNSPWFSPINKRVQINNVRWQTATSGGNQGTSFLLWSRVGVHPANRRAFRPATPVRHGHVVFPDRWIGSSRWRLSDRFWRGEQRPRISWVSLSAIWNQLQSNSCQVYFQTFFSLLSCMRSNIPLLACRLTATENPPIFWFWFWCFCQCSSRRICSNCWEDNRHHGEGPITGIYNNIVGL